MSGSRGKSSKEYPVNAGVPQGSILDLTLFLLYIIDPPDRVVCDIAICTDDTTLQGFPYSSKGGIPPSHLVVVVVVVVVGVGVEGRLLGEGNLKKSNFDDSNLSKVKTAFCEY